MSNQPQPQPDGGTYVVFYLIVFCTITCISLTVLTLIFWPLLPTLFK